MNLEENVKRYFHVFVGSYGDVDTERIRVLQFDADNGTLTSNNGVSGIDNASFLTITKNGTRLYAVSESHEGAVVSYAIHEGDGSLTEINRQPTLGDSPCYVSVGASGEYLFAVNYMSGTICLFPIQEDGGLLPMAHQIQHTGRGTHPVRQDAPHPHAIVTEPYTDTILVSDLGTDQIHQYEVDDSLISFRSRGYTKLTESSGPRHFAFHPQLRIVYVIQELRSTVDVYRWDERVGLGALLQTISTIPDDWGEENTAADIHVDPLGNYLYASNRGHNSIVTFAVQTDGTLERLEFTSTKGRTPRNFALVPESEYILVANQDSDTVVVMRRRNGIPEPTGEQMVVSRPVCIQVMPISMES